MMKLSSKLLLLVSLALSAMALLATAAYANTDATVTVAEVGEALGTEAGAGVLTGTLAVTCDESTISITADADGTGVINDVTWAACTTAFGSCTVTLDTAATGDVTDVSGGGVLTIDDGQTASATITCGAINCTASADTTLNASVTNSGTTPSQLAITNQDVNMTGGLFTCGVVGTWTQTWTVESTADGTDTTVTILG